MTLPAEYAELVQRLHEWHQDGFGEIFLEAAAAIEKLVAERDEACKEADAQMYQRLAAEQALAAERERCAKIAEGNGWEATAAMIRAADVGDRQ